jgi:hypothetical protein
MFTREALERALETQQGGERGDRVESAPPAGNAERAIGVDGPARAATADELRTSRSGHARALIRCRSQSLPSAKKQRR